MKQGIPLNFFPIEILSRDRLSSPISLSFENKEGDIMSQSQLKCLMQGSEQLDQLVKVCVLNLVSSLGRGAC